MIVHLGKLAGPTRGELDGQVEDIGLEELRELHEKRSPLVLSIPPERITLRVEKSMHFQVEDRPGKPRCIIVGVPLGELHRLFQLHGTGLLDRNVRLYVGKKTPANKGMMTTLREQAERDKFFFYNNGLCFLASRIEKPVTDGNHVTIGLHRPQLDERRANLLHDREVRRRSARRGDSLSPYYLSSGGDTDERFIDTVIRATNTQTPVTSRDFHANDALQKKLLERFSRLEPPWFYERKAGLWNALDGSIKDHSRYIPLTLSSSFEPSTTRRWRGAFYRGMVARACRARRGERSSRTVLSEEGLYSTPSRRIVTMTPMFMMPLSHTSLTCS